MRKDYACGLRKSCHKGEMAKCSISFRDYLAGQAMPMHRDDRSHLTIVVAGGFLEETPRDGAVVSAADILLKPRDIAHENRFSPAGARLARVFLEEEDLPRNEGGEAWRIRRRGNDLSAALTLWEAAANDDETTMRTAVDDLLVGPLGAVRRKAAPWLYRLRDELGEVGLKGCDVAARARAAGVHPVHASRAFAQAFGESVTAYAQMAAIRRALPALAGHEERLSEIAVEVGFYDQSHMCRVFARRLGRSPSAVRAMMAG